MTCETTNPSGEILRGFHVSGYGKPRYNPGMSEERKSSVWPWVVALLFVLPMLYVASFGPVIWILARGARSSRESRDVIYRIYAPLVDCASSSGRNPIARGLLFWAEVGCMEQREARFELFVLPPYVDEE